MAKEKPKTRIYRGKSLPRGKESQLRKKPGRGSTGKYKNLPKGEFAGPEGTFPINTLARARNALARAHFSPNPGAIKRKVYAKWPELKARAKARGKKV
jgi:hypothetical protein